MHEAGAGDGVDCRSIRDSKCELGETRSVARGLTSNFRMNEFTAAVLRGQLRKLETICGALRNHAKRVREGIADLPGLKLRNFGNW